MPETTPMRKISIRVTVNGAEHEVLVEPRRLLADFLREDLGLTGTHLGCEHGVCGACTVLLEGESVRSCLLFAVQANNRSVMTVEGLASADGSLHPIQQAFWEQHGLQCGFCTPGFLMTAYELLRANPVPSEDEIRSAISGNLCRCTGYQNIVRSVRAAAEKMGAAAGTPVALS
jgi:aerobic carbon-monoxide dehydrogenase small subunit